MLASSREPRGAARSPGGPWPSPTNLPNMPGPKGTAATHRASVGRDALIPPHPAAAQTFAGGYGIRPYGRRRMPRPTGKPRPPVTTNLCRGRCLHCARRRVSEANRAAGPALRPEIVPRTLRRRKAPGGINPAPTNLPKCPAKPDGRNHPGDRRAGCPHPAAPRGGANVCGRIWNPPLRSMVGYATNREPQPCRTANPCRGRCLHRPGNPAAPEGPREG